MLVKAAINGGRTKTEHPSTPLSPNEIAAAVVESVIAGASAIHFHIRSQDSRESLAAEDLARTLQVVRVAAPDGQIGVTLVPGSFWIQLRGQLGVTKHFPVELQAVEHCSQHIRNWIAVLDFMERNPLDSRFLVRWSHRPTDGFTLQAGFSGAEYIRTIKQKVRSLAHYAFVQMYV